MLQHIAGGAGCSSCYSQAECWSGPLGRRLRSAVAGNTITTPLFKVNVTPRDAEDRGSVSSAIQILAVMTMLTLAPSIIFLMTSFTRIVIVLGFVRNALGVQGAPSNQILIGLSLFLTMFIMAPVWGEIQKEAYDPYMAEELAPQGGADQGRGADEEIHAAADADE